MASDHLRVNIEFLSGGPLRERGLLLYAPSTVKTLKEELSHAHGVAVEEIVVYLDGVLLEDKMRVVDKCLYHVRLPPKWTDPLAGGLGKGVVAVDKTVTIGEGVHVDSMIEVDTAPIVLDARMYIAFAFSDVVRLFDVTHGAILSPTPLMRLGYCVIYADWTLLRPLTRGVPTDPTTWLYDRLRRDYGVLATSSVFDIHTAPLAELQRYRLGMEHWMARQPVGGLESGVSIEKWMEPLEEEEEGEEEEGEEGDEDEDEEDPWRGTELDDSEWWR